MPVDPNPEINNSDASPDPGHGVTGDRQPAHGASQPAVSLVLVVVVGAIVAGGYRLLAGPLGGPQPAPSVAAKVPVLIRAGERITVPEGSPMRTSLAVEPVAEQDVQRNLVLPAAVEADPARLILPDETRG
jgi:hypothetical protein